MLAPLVQQVVGRDVKLISSSEETADEVVATLTSRGHLHDETPVAPCEFFTTGEDLDDFRQVGGKIYGRPIEHLTHVGFDELAL